MMDEELSLLKKSLLSLVVSSATTMTVSRLLKDYRNIVGGTLPLGKYGYREPVQFLIERCTDIFIVEGPKWDPILTPKVTKNLAHIDQMVQKQKVQSSLKYKGKRRSVLQPSQPVESKPVTRNVPLNGYNAPNRYDKPPPVIRKITKILDTEPKVTEQNIRKENNVSGRYTENDSSYKSNGNDTACNTNDNNNEKEYIDSNLIEECNPSTALSKFYKKRLPQYNSDMDFLNPDAENNSKSSAESGRQSSSSSSSKQALLDELKAEIVALINDSDDGVWCTDLIKLYKERYGRELRFHPFGHTSIISLVYSIEDRISITRPQPDGDWLLQEPGRACAPAPRRAPRRAPPRALPADSDDALPGVDFEPDVFPPDCLHYLESIPAARLQALAPPAQLEVLIGEVYSPSHFWMLRVGPEHNLAMEQLMDEMTEYYLGAGAARALARGAVRVGQYCASVYDGDWHRSLIVSIIDSDSVKVRHVDYGTVDTVPVSGLKPLRREWSLLPAQAIRARLAACRPAAAGWRWPRAACAWLLDRVRERRLYANVLHVDWEDDIVETFLIDTSGEQDACLSRDLIRAGHADRRAHAAAASQSEDCYLYPRFEALEQGATPNYADICRMLADGIALEYVDTYRRHVPGPWARRPPPPAPPTPPRPAASALELLNRIPLLRLEEREPPSPPAPAPSSRSDPTSERTREPVPPLFASSSWYPAPRPPLPAGACCPRAPAPPPGGAEVRLSEAEWAVLAHLRGADARAAHWYALSAAWRALMPPPPGL